MTSSALLESRPSRSPNVVMSRFWISGAWSRLSGFSAARPLLCAQSSSRRRAMSSVLRDLTKSTLPSLGMLKLLNKSRIDLNAVASWPMGTRGSPDAMTTREDMFVFWTTVAAKIGRCRRLEDDARCGQCDGKDERKMLLA